MSMARTRARFRRFFREMTRQEGGHLLGNGNNSKWPQDDLSSFALPHYPISPLLVPRRVPKYCSTCQFRGKQSTPLTRESTLPPFDFLVSLSSGPSALPIPGCQYVVSMDVTDNDRLSDALMRLVSWFATVFRAPPREMPVKPSIVLKPDGFSSVPINSLSL
jgi:hypothetical protein